MSAPDLHPRPAVPFAVATLGIALFSAMDALMKGLSLAIGTYNALLWRTLAGAAIGGAPSTAARAGVGASALGHIRPIPAPAARTRKSAFCIAPG